MEIRSATARIQAILEAAFEGNLSFLEIVPSNELHSARCRSGCTSLHWAAGNDQVETVRYLVSKGFSVDVAGTGKSRGRTPLHYACRNGCLRAAKLLVGELGADVNATAKHQVTPFQLAVWRNQFDICQWLVETHEVDPAQVNEFECAAVHWLGIAPVECANRSGELNEEGADLLPLAKWLAEQPSIDFAVKQYNGHSPLHKAAWGGHLALCQYLHRVHNLWDDSPDEAGNYAADLCDMANTPRHARIAQYLRNYCSSQRAKSCHTLNIPVDADQGTIRQSFLELARQHHPDRGGNAEMFDAIRKAHEHLTVGKGRGNQQNASHSLNLMLQQVGGNPTAEYDCTKARMIAVLLEYGERGLDLSNLRKKWRQVWPKTAFPVNDHVRLSVWLREHLSDVVELRIDQNNTVRAHAKQFTHKASTMATEETHLTQ